MHVQLASTADAGNRQVAIMIFAKSGEFIFYFIGEDQVASKIYYYNFFEGIPYDAALHLDTYYCPLPELFLFEGQSINISEFNGINAGDDMKNYLLIEETELLLEEYEYFLDKGV